VGHGTGSPRRDGGGRGLRAAERHVGGVADEVAGPAGERHATETAIADAPRRYRAPIGLRDRHTSTGSTQSSRKETRFAT
jgi:hypothetical protein